MEEIKKRKLQDLAFDSQSSSDQHLRSLLDPLSKPQLVELLAQIGTEYPAIADKIKSVASADPVHRKLFVRGLSWNTTSEMLCDAFRLYGEIEEGAVIYDKASGKSRGYGFITYKDIESTHIALKAPSLLIDGRMAVCNLACEGLTGASTTPDLPQRKLYIGSLSSEVTSEILLSFFGKHGEIEEGSVAYDKDTSESRGFGFVTYKTVEATKKALDDPNKILGGRTIIVKLADSNKVRTQSQISPAMATMSVPPMASGYMLHGKPHPSSNTQMGYGYPQSMSYHDSLSSPSAHTQYPTQPQIPYPSSLLKKDSLGHQPTNHLGMGGGGYPYYMGKQ